ncbi:MAG TPA: hypothetical protein VEN81_05815 [Planctomycetota bacterium]|nr:hypothetical protein [Planctomycetota bacterium]
MADSSAKRIREARKRQHREMKDERKRLRKEGLLGHDNSGLFLPGEKAREVVDLHKPAPDPVPPKAPEPPAP